MIKKRLFIVSMAFVFSNYSMDDGVPIELPWVLGAFQTEVLMPEHQRSLNDSYITTQLSLYMNATSKNSLELQKDRLVINNFFYLCRSLCDRVYSLSYSSISNGQFYEQLKAMHSMAEKGNPEARHWVGCYWQVKLDDPRRKPDKRWIQKNMERYFSMNMAYPPSRVQYGDILLRKNNTEEALQCYENSVFWPYFVLLAGSDGVLYEMQKTYIHIPSLQRLIKRSITGSELWNWSIKQARMYAPHLLNDVNIILPVPAKIPLLSEEQIAFVTSLMHQQDSKEIDAESEEDQQDDRDFQEIDECDESEVVENKEVEEELNLEPTLDQVRQYVQSLPAFACSQRNLLENSFLVNCRKVCELVACKEWQRAQEHVRAMTRSAKEYPLLNDVEQHNLLLMLERVKKSFSTDGILFYRAFELAQYYDRYKTEEMCSDLRKKAEDNNEWCSLAQWYARKKDIKNACKYYKQYVVWHNSKKKKKKSQKQKICTFSSMFSCDEQYNVDDLKKLISACMTYKDHDGAARYLTRLKQEEFGDSELEALKKLIKEGALANFDEFVSLVDVVANKTDAQTIASFYCAFKESFKETININQFALFIESLQRSQSIIFSKMHLKTEECVKEQKKVAHEENKNYVLMIDECLWDALSKCQGIEVAALLKYQDFFCSYCECRGDWQLIIPFVKKLIEVADALDFSFQDNINGESACFFSKIVNLIEKLNDNKIKKAFLEKCLQLQLFEHAIMFVERLEKAFFCNDSWHSNKLNDSWYSNKLEEYAYQNPRNAFILAMWYSDRLLLYAHDEKKLLNKQKKIEEFLVAAIKKGDSDISSKAMGLLLNRYTSYVNQRELTRINIKVLNAFLTNAFKTKEECSSDYVRRQVIILLHRCTVLGCKEAIACLFDYYQKKLNEKDLEETLLLLTNNTSENADFWQVIVEKWDKFFDGRKSKSDDVCMAYARVVYIWCFFKGNEDYALQKIYLEKALHLIKNIDENKSNALKKDIISYLSVCCSELGDCKDLEKYLSGSSYSAIYKTVGNFLKKGDHGLAYAKELAKKYFYCATALASLLLYDEKNEQFIIDILNNHYLSEECIQCIEIMRSQFKFYSSFEQEIISQEKLKALARSDRFLYALGNYFLGSEESYGVACKEFGELYKQEPDNLRYMTYYGLSLFSAGQYDPALALFDNIINCIQEFQDGEIPHAYAHQIMYRLGREMFSEKHKKELLGSMHKIILLYMKYYFAFGQKIRELFLLSYAIYSMHYCAEGNYDFFYDQLKQYFKNLVDIFMQFHGDQDNDRKINLANVLLSTCCIIIDQSKKRNMPNEDILVKVKEYIKYCLVCFPASDVLHGAIDGAFVHDEERNALIGMSKSIYNKAPDGIKNNLSIIIFSLLPRGTDEYVEWCKIAAFRNNSIKILKTFLLAWYGRYHHQYNIKNAHNILGKNANKNILKLINEDTTISDARICHCLYALSCKEFKEVVDYIEKNDLLTMTAISFIFNAKNGKEQIKKEQKELITDLRRCMSLIYMVALMNNGAAHMYKNKGKNSELEDKISKLALLLYHLSGSGDIGASDRISSLQKMFVTYAPLCKEIEDKAKDFCGNNKDLNVLMLRYYALKKLCVINDENRDDYKTYIARAQTIKFENYKDFYHKMKEKKDFCDQIKKEGKIEETKQLCEEISFLFKVFVEECVLKKEYEKALSFIKKYLSDDKKLVEIEQDYIDFIRESVDKLISLRPSKKS